MSGPLLSDKAGPPLLHERPSGEVGQGAAMVNAGPLTGNIAYHHVGFSPVDVTVWIGLVGVLIFGIGRQLKGNLIPTKDPTLGMSLSHEVM